jgi:hypothetical protein
VELPEPETVCVPIPVSLTELFQHLGSVLYSQSHGCMEFESYEKEIPHQVRKPSLRKTLQKDG